MAAPASARAQFLQNVGSTPIELCGHRCALTGGVVINVSGGAQAYVQLFNKRSTAVTLGTTTPDDIVPISPGDNDMLLNGTVPTEWDALTIACTTTPTGAVASLCHVSYHIG